MLLQITTLIAGIILLVWGADRFVEGASVTARNLGVAPLAVGLLVVGFGTSGPEMMISAVAAFEGNTGIAIGNAVGSNIANIALILGLTPLIQPLSVHSSVLTRELPILLVAMLFALAMLSDGILGRIDGMLLLGGFALSVYWTVTLAFRGRTRSDTEDAMAKEFAAELAVSMPMNRAVFWVVVGLALLLIASRMLVWSATGIARSLGVSELVIGLSIVAVGTSLPELAASLSAAFKKEDDIAIGNIVGSNTFNMAVLGLPGLIAPGSFEAAVLQRDFPIMVRVRL